MLAVLAALVGERSADHGGRRPPLGQPAGPRAAGGGARPPGLDAVRADRHDSARRRAARAAPVGPPDHAGAAARAARSRTAPPSCCAAMLGDRATGGARRRAVRPQRWQPALPGGAGRAAWPAGGETDQLPDSLRALVAARLDELPADQRAMLDNAAVLGSSGSYGGLVEFGQALGQNTARSLARRAGRRRAARGRRRAGGGSARPASARSPTTRSPRPIGPAATSAWPRP